MAILHSVLHEAAQTSHEVAAVLTVLTGEPTTGPTLVGPVPDLVLSERAHRRRITSDLPRFARQDFFELSGPAGCSGISVTMRRSRNAVAGGGDCAEEPRSESGDFAVGLRYKDRRPR